MQMKLNILLVSLLGILAVNVLSSGTLLACQATDSDQTEKVEKRDRDNAANALKQTESVGKAKPSEGWPFFRGDTQSTGVARTELVKNLEVLWEFKVPKGAFEGTAAIVGDKNSKMVYIGDLDGKLFALDLNTGKLNWEFQVEIGFVTGPAYRNDMIYLGDIDGYFYCVDKNGQLKWKHSTDAEINSSANFFDDNVVFGSQDANLYALNAKTGKEAWKFQAADQIRCGMTVADGKAFVAGCDGGLHLIDLTNGEELSSVDIASPTGVTPAVMGDMVFVGTEQAGFYAIDWKKSKVVWSLDCDGASIRSCAAVNKDHIIFGAHNRTVYSRHPKTGKENWKVVLRSKIESSPVIVGDRVYIGSSDGRLYGLNLADGKIVWEKQLNGGIIGSPAIAFGRLVVATDRGVVYCLGEAKTK